MNPIMLFPLPHYLACPFVSRLINQLLLEVALVLKRLTTYQLEKIGAPFRAGEYYLEKWKYAVDEFGNVPYSR